MSGHINIDNKDYYQEKNINWAYKKTKKPIIYSAFNSGRIAAYFFLMLAILSAFGAVYGNQLIYFFMFSQVLCAFIIIFRLFGVIYAKEEAKLKRIKNITNYPIYTILLPVYKETRSVENLIYNIKALNWPEDKKEIIFLCEEDDRATIEILKEHINDYKYQIIIVPQTAIKTKPNAMQYALKFIKGEYIAVYDAEDIPDKNQLLIAYDCFRKNPEAACVQAPLITYNTKHWIASQFTLEYAVWFRIMLPSLAKFSGFFPLGGTSNHFKTNVLRKIGGWDKYNLTEDADLGVRIARFGFKSILINAPTYEEAPISIKSYIKQRSRWIGGHLQTIEVHLRQPLILLKNLSITGVISFIFGIFSGPLIAAIRAPLLIIILLQAYFNKITDDSLVLLLISFSAEILISTSAIRRDGRRELLLNIFTLPFYWILQFPAFILAIYNLTLRPHYWEKTEHGLIIVK